VNQYREGKVAELKTGRYDLNRREQEKGYLKDSVIESWSPVRVGEAIQKKKGQAICPHCGKEIR